MIVAEVLSKKGTDVITISVTSSIVEAVAQLAAHQIGALVVVGDGGQLAGIFTERDLVRVLASEGPAALEAPVAEAMTADPVTCVRSDRISEVLATMSRGHFRHMPVVEAGAVVGVVSIRDMVLERLDHVETEAEAMRAYLAGS